MLPFFLLFFLPPTHIFNPFPFFFFLLRLTELTASCQERVHVRDNKLNVIGTTNRTLPFLPFSRPFSFFLKIAKSLVHVSEEDSPFPTMDERSMLA